MQCACWVLCWKNHWAAYWKLYCIIIIIIICNVKVVLLLPQKPTFILLLLPNHAFIFSNMKHSVRLMLRPRMMMHVQNQKLKENRPRCTHGLKKRCVLTSVSVCGCLHDTGNPSVVIFRLFECTRRHWTAGICVKITVKYLMRFVIPATLATIAAFTTNMWSRWKHLYLLHHPPVH